MLPKTVEFTDDQHDEFVDTLIFEEEQVKMIEGNAIIDAPASLKMGQNKAEIGI